MSKTVIFAGSYPQIKNALYLATHSSSDGPITIVIPGHHDLFKFFQAINEKVFHNNINLIYFERYQGKRASDRGLSQALHVLPDILGERRYLKGIFNKYFAKLDGADIFFSSRCFCPYTFYLLKILGKGNKLIHVCDPSMDGREVEKYTPAKIIDLASLIISKLIYGLDITRGKVLSMNFLCMSDKFYNREIDRVIDIEERDEMMKGFDLFRYKIFDTGNYSVIYFDEGLVESEYVNMETFRSELTKIFELILKYFPEKDIARKYHPGSLSDKAIISIGDIFPDYIPAELLYNDHVKIYLSGFSFAIANVEKGLAVSFADLVTLKDEKFKNHLREVLLQNSKSEILFPKSLDEFERILINSKK